MPPNGSFGTQDGQEPRRYAAFAAGAASRRYCRSCARARARAGGPRPALLRQTHNRAGDVPRGPPGAQGSLPRAVLPAFAMSPEPQDANVSTAASTPPRWHPFARQELTAAVRAPFSSAGPHPSRTEGRTRTRSARPAASTPSISPPSRRRRRLRPPCPRSRQPGHSRRRLGTGGRHRAHGRPPAASSRCRRRRTRPRCRRPRRARPAISCRAALSTCRARLARGSRDGSEFRARGLGSRRRAHSVRARRVRPGGARTQLPRAMG